MIPAVPQPDPIALPAPLWLLWGLLILTFTLHLLPMNFVLGGSIVGMVARLGGARGSADDARLAAWIARAMPVAIASAVTLGVAALLFQQVLYGRLFFTSAVLMGWFWLAVIPLLITGYYGAYALAFGGQDAGVNARWLAAGIAGLFLAIAFVYSNNMSLMLRPFEFVARYQADGRGLHLATADPALVPRFLHMVVGALAVTGLVVAGYGLTLRARDRAFGTWAVRHGSLWFSTMTAVNLLIGFIWLAMLPRDSILRFMGANPGATVVLALGMMLGFGALVTIFMAGSAKNPAPLVKAGVGLVVATLVLMVVTRDHVRQAALDTAGFQPASWIVPQWGSIFVFLVLLVAALAVVTWMVVALARGRK
jgi:hypothetical protein